MKKKNILLIIIFIILFSFGFMVFFTSKEKKKNIIKDTIKKNGFHFEKYSKGKKNFSIKGDKYYLGNDKQIHVQGNVKTVFYKGNKIIKINSDELTYTFDLKNLFFKKNVVVNINNIKLYANELFYADLIVLKSTQEVKLKSDTFSFRASDFYYNLKKEILVFRKLKDFIVNNKNTKYYIKAKNLLYYKKENKINLRGSPIKITTIKNNEQYEYILPFLNIFLDDNNSLKEGFTPNLMIKTNNSDKQKKINREIKLKNINLFWNNGKLSSIISNEPGQMIQYKDSVKRIFNFKNIKVYFSSVGKIDSINLKKLKTIFYQGKIRFGFGKANLTKIIFLRSGGIGNLLFTGKESAFIIDKDIKSSAKIISIFPKKEINIFTGNSGVAIINKIIISANYLFLNKSKDYILADKNVKGHLIKENMDFLCNQFIQKGDSFKFKENVYLKEGNLEIKGNTVDFNKKNHIFKIEKGDITKDDIFIKGDEIKKMKDKIEIKKEIIFKKNELKVNGDSAYIIIKKGKYERVIINKNVKIDYKKGKGKTDKLIFYLDKQIVKMLGNARFKKDKGVDIEGDELTLNLHNGKIYAISKRKKQVKIILKKENDKSD